jgi:ATP-dependent exoDNAse (exonuclease V) alpha subunit
VAIYRFSAQVIGRSSGRSATAAAAYRAGVEIVDVRTGELHDYTRRSGVDAAFIVAPESAPPWALDRASLWNAVEQAEKRKDAQLAREVQLALPHELTPAQREALVREFVQAQFVDRGMVADVALHAPGKGDDRNHHAHVMLTMRTLGPDGFGQKARDWNDKALLEGWRVQWEQAANRALERAGVEARIDHRSLVDQGITDRLPVPELSREAYAFEQATGQASAPRLLREAAQAQLDTLRGLQAANEAAIKAEVLAFPGRATEPAPAVPAVPGKAPGLRTVEPAKKQQPQTAAEWQHVERLAAERWAALDPDRAPAVVTARGDAEKAAGLVAAWKRERTKAEAEELAYRQARPIRAWLHDRGLLRAAPLAQAIDAKAKAEDSIRRAAPLAEAAEKAHAAARAEAHQGSAAEREKMRQVREHAAKQAKEAAERERQQRDAERHAEGLIRDWRELAARKESAGTPESMRKALASYRAMDAEKRKAFEERLAAKLAASPDARREMQRDLDRAGPQRGRGGPSR